MAYPFSEVEPRWQQAWRDERVYRALDPHETDKPGFYVLDMFPYPSGSGLHVGHPEGYTATDILSRYKRMRGFNVLHPMGWDAFGLPAEQYAVQTGAHPAQTTATNIATFRRQIESLGLGYDWEREINTTDPAYYKWTQWIFLKLFDSYFDPIEKRAMPVSHLENGLFNANLVVTPDGRVVENPTQEGLEAIGGEVRVERTFAELDPDERRALVDNQRLAYVAEAPVNWCPALGTVLANEEVVDGKSERGGHPVERRPMRQWMLRISAYADRLLDDLDLLDWPPSLKEMQRNWIGRSTGAAVSFPVAGGEADGLTIDVFTTRPDTLFGATYMVLAPEHPLVSRITTPDARDAVDAYLAAAAGRSERDRTADTRDKTGVFTGAYAVNPLTEKPVPVWVADYVLAGYGTGAIMAVPAHDERDFEFATRFGLPVVPVVGPADGSPPPPDRAFVDDGIAFNSGFLDGLPTDQAKDRVIKYLAADGAGRARVNYKLRDWLFSRQRYWGEPFPILLDAAGNPYPVDESDLPVTLPDVSDFKPTGTPEGPLSKAADWLSVEKDGRTFTRETNTMPQWAGSCWYYLRYLDPHNDSSPVDPAKERYWMPVDLYVGGVEHAVLHLLYARFWHKVLFDLGVVSTPEPFRRLVNQGLILGEVEYTVPGPDGSERRVEPDEVEKKGDGFFLKTDPSVRVDARAHKMSKSRGNVVNPDAIVRDFGADVFRLYEMYMGPLEAPKPWNTRDIVGMTRFLNGVWRTFAGDPDAASHPVVFTDDPLPEPLERKIHRTVKKVGEDVEALRFNTAIAELIKLANDASRLPSIPRRFADVYVRLLAPFAPHIAEEIWRNRLGYSTSVVVARWPDYDENLLAEANLEVPVQVNGKLRGKVTVAAGSPEGEVLAAAEAAVADRLAGQTVRKRVYVPGRLVNFVAN